MSQQSQSTNLLNNSSIMTQRSESLFNTQTDECAERDVSQSNQSEVSQSIIGGVLRKSITSQKGSKRKASKKDASEAAVAKKVSKKAVEKKTETNTDSQTSKKEPEFNEQECDTIVTIMVEHKHIIECDDSTAQQKTDVYKLMWRKINALGYANRTYDGVTRKMRNIRTSVMNKFGPANVKKTGGGKPLKYRNFEKKLWDEFFKGTAKGEGIKGSKESSVHRKRPSKDNPLSEMTSEVPEVPDLVQNETTLRMDEEIRYSENMQAVSNFLLENGETSSTALTPAKVSIRDVRQLDSDRSYSQQIDALNVPGKTLRVSGPGMKDLLVTANSNCNTEELEDEISNMLRKGISQLELVANTTEEGDNRGVVDSDETVDEGQPQQSLQHESDTNMQTDADLNNADLSNDQMNDLYETEDGNVHRQPDFTPTDDNQQPNSTNRTSEERNSVTNWTDAEAQDLFIERIGIPVNNRLLEELHRQVQLLDPDAAPKIIEALRERNMKKKRRMMKKAIGIEVPSQKCRVICEILSARSDWFKQLMDMVPQGATRDEKHQFAAMCCEKIASNLALSNDMRRVYRSYASINVGFDDIIDDEDYQDETGGPQDTTRDEGGDAVGLHSNMGAHGDGGRARRAVGSTSQPHSQGIRTTIRPLEAVDAGTDLNMPVRFPRVETNDGPSARDVYNVLLPEDRSDGEQINVYDADDEEPLDERNRRRRNRAVNKFWSEYRLRMRRHKYLGVDMRRCQEQTQFIINQEVRMNKIHEKNKCELAIAKQQEELLPQHKEITEKKLDHIKKEEERVAEKHKEEMEVLKLKKQLLKLQVERLGGSID